MAYYRCGAGKPEEEKTVTAGTSTVTVTPTSGKTMKKVTVSPTPSETKTATAGTSAITVTPTSGKLMSKVTVNPTPSQSKSATPSTSAQTISPDSGKLLSSVSISAIQTETKTVTAGTSASTVTPTSGKYLSSVTVNPTPSQSKTVTPTTSKQTVTPDSGKLLSSVTVNGMQIPTGIAVTTAPTKTSYKAGESINLSGMVVKVTYSDGTTADITSACAFSPSAGTTVYESTDKITVTWVWNNITYTTTQAITVTRVLSSIAITTQPTTRSYYKGDTLNLSGMVVKATYNSGATATVTSYTTSPASGSTLSTYGTITVTVSYTENGVTKTTTTTVTVSVKTVTWAGGSDADIVAMVEAADAGFISLGDYWAVGQERTVTLPAMAATNVGETHAAQTVTLVLLNKGGKTLTSGKTCSFIVGLKDSLNEAGYMNSSNTNTGSWESSKRRAWCNNEFKTAMLSTGIGAIFKQHYNITAKTYNGTTNQTSTDWFALAAAKEIFGGTASSAGSATSYSNLTEFNALTQFSYYTDSSHRIKKRNGSADHWWERSPRYNNGGDFCYVYSDGTANYTYASITCGLAPFGCI